MDPKKPSPFPSQLEKSKGNYPNFKYGSELGQMRSEKENLVVWNSMECSSTTPGRPLFMFVSRKKSLPSKWVDAEKWLFSRGSKTSNSMSFVSDNQKKKIQVFSDNSRVDCKIDSSASSLDVPLKEPTKEAFFIKRQNLQSEPLKDVCTEVVKMKHRDIGTDDMSLTPLMSTSPARHNTPTSGSGLLAQSVPIHDITKQLRECHLHFGLAQFDPEATPWSSREDEEEEMSKSLRHSVSGPRACAWELQEEKSIKEKKPKFKHGWIFKLPKQKLNQRN